MNSRRPHPFRVLFLCTGNSARSQMAEAVLNLKGAGRFEAHSEACPVFPGQPILAHWGMPDPAAVTGTGEVQHAAFIEALTLISCRIDLLLALPVEKLEHLALQLRVQAIGNVGLEVDAPAGAPGS